MNILLILLGIYVYFLISHLLINLVYFLESKDLLEPSNKTWEEEEFVDKCILLFLLPVLSPILIPLFMLIHNRGKLPEFSNIPFTPKKVADLICNFKIKIEKK